MRLDMGTRLDPGSGADLEGLVDAQLGHVAHSASDDVHAYPCGLVSCMACSEI